MLKTFFRKWFGCALFGVFCLLLAACNDSSHQTIADNAEGFPELAQLVAFSSNANSSHLACAQHYRESCLLEQFPPLGVEKNTPLTISDIEQRLFVSHPWMAERFYLCYPHCHRHCYRYFAQWVRLWLQMMYVRRFIALIPRQFILIRVTCGEMKRNG